MTEHQIAHWLRQVLAAGDAITDAHDAEAGWVKDIGEAMSLLRRAQDRVRDPLLASLPPVEDRQAPWVCIGCSLVYQVCPDPNAHDCPACGTKVCPARLWARAVVRCQGITEHLCGILAAERTGTDMVCTCGIPYRQHPHCAHSRLPESMSGSLRPEYFLHVLCDGRHVKL